ncbi:WAT1-related protein At5g47470-like [Diospyros lotus]|uniref:WAT1-related protein At5g47470-like n=1 Tax=Diospyros lotus TaxID=55363 RepID=UPI00224EF728|nr:WAT1-related protein At5g47470-like [Diospyros lotus]
MVGTTTTPNAAAIENITIIGGLIGLQFIYAGNSVLVGYFMLLGLNPSTIIIFCALATSLVFSPLSFYHERSLWPKKLSLKLWIQLLLISFGGVTLFQTLLLQGIKLTSPAMATAMPNLAPGLIFLIASVLGLERVDLNCMYTKIKIVGTLMCVIGAITMSIMQSRMAQRSELAAPQPVADDQSHFDTARIAGCLYLMAAVFVLSTNVVLQASALSDFPAPMSLCAITSWMGMIITALVELIQGQKFDLGPPTIARHDIVICFLLGGIVGGGCASFNAWALKKRGPVLVSMFMPIGTVISVIFSISTLGDNFGLGSLLGMLLMFMGLYFFLWAKSREDFSVSDRDALESDCCDIKKPLCS